MVQGLQISTASKTVEAVLGVIDAAGS